MVTRAGSLNRGARDKVRHMITVNGIIMMAAKPMLTPDEIVGLMYLVMVG